MLPALVEDGLISEFVFVHIPETTNDLQGSEQVRRRIPTALMLFTAVQCVAVNEEAYSETF